jgi:cytochrome c-type biogenesis protein CcsB
MKTLFLLFVLLLSFDSMATETFFCQNSIESLPIQQGGRVKPLYVHAGETIKYLTGKSKVGKLTPVQAYCLLSLTALGMPNNFKLTTRIEHVDLKKLFNLSDSNPTISYDQMFEDRDLVRTEVMKIKDESSYKKALNKTFQKIMLYNDIKSGNNWLIPKKINQDIEWIPSNQYFTESKVKALHKEGVKKPFLKLIKISQKSYIEIKSDSYLLEIIYAKAKLPLWALIITLIALAVSVTIRKLPIILTLCSLTLFIQTVFLVLRVLISGRAPITNMYETVLVSGYAALIIALIIGHFKKDKIYISVGLGYNVCTLMMLNFAGGMLSGAIGPLVPVLRDNFWLSTHVTAVITSYGALALSWILANTILIKSRFKKLNQADYTYYTDLIYSSIKFGVVFLAGGVILGGVWADYSWGRFWGWDPKETWSLIVLLIYMAILHGRSTSWITNKRFVPLTAAAFLSVMMAWFGVNYILASGLHSYGFSEGGAIFLFTFFAVQILIIVFCTVNIKTKANNG